MNMLRPESLTLSRLPRPVTFGADGAQLFGWYHPPATEDGRSRDCLVVLCNPLGYEAICTHRHYRVLAQQLSQSGFAVLRYAHHGTGDSAGSSRDPQRLAAWLDGIVVATAFGRRCSQARRVCLFGVRMGGTMALAAAPGLADAVIAWSPFASGAQFLREARALQRLGQGGEGAVPEAVSEEYGEEVAGYRYTAQTVAALEQLNLVEGAAAPAPEVLLLRRDDVTESDRLARHLEQHNCRLTRLEVPGYAGMMRDTFDAEVPQAALEQVRAWLEQRHPLEAPAFAGPVGSASALVAGTDEAPGAVLERAVNFGPGGFLFGIVAAPLHSQQQRRTGVLLVSVGSNHHVGPNRMYVAQARALAAKGCVTLRMDIGGVGDSPPAPGQRDNHLYAEHSIGEVREALRYLRQRYALQRLVLVGLCSGAYLSFRAAAAAEGAEVAGMVLINPQTFSWHDGDSPALRVRRSIHAVGFYRSRLFMPETWRRLFNGEVSIRLIITGLAATLGKRLLLRLSGWLRRWSGIGGGGQDVRGKFRKLLRRGVDTLLIYSADDGGLNEMEIQLGAGASALQRFDNFQLSVVDGADHTFTPLWAQRRLLEMLCGHVLRIDRQGVAH